MKTLPINAAELVPWCERHGVDATVIVAECAGPIRRDGSLVYMLRRYDRPHADVEVVVPLDDPMPPIFLVPRSP